MRLARSYERDQPLYDWLCYIALVAREPGALRSGASFKTMPEPLQELQRQLLRHSGGDREMAQVLMGVGLSGPDKLVKSIVSRLTSCGGSNLVGCKILLFRSLIAAVPLNIESFGCQRTWCHE